MSQADDIRAMLTEFDEGTLTFGTVSSPCTFRTYDEPVQLDNIGGAPQLIRRAYACVYAGDFPGLVEDSIVVVNEQTYKVVNTELIQDGQVLQIRLKVS